jgi:hypothetical protein
MEIQNTFDYRGQTLSDAEIYNILKSINTSLPQHNDMVSKEKLITTNGKYLNRWNYIFKDIDRLFDSEYYEVPIFDRGPLWEFAAIYNRDNRILYILTKEANVSKIIKENNSTHYIRILSYKNNKLGYDYQKQLSLLPCNDEMIELSLKDFKRMFLNIDEVECCKAIIFKEGNMGVTKISEAILDYDLNFIDNHDLSDYIIADIDNIEDTQSYENIDILDDELKEEIKLPLRKKKIQKKKESGSTFYDKEDIVTEENLNNKEQDNKNEKI